MSAVARRYAKALFALAKESAALETTATEISRVATLAEDPTVAPVLLSPLLATPRRRALVQMLARELALSDLLARFLGLLADHQRLGELAPIAAHFQHLLDEDLGRVRVAIRSAAPLDPSQHDALVAAFARLTAKQVIPTVTIEPDLLGGVLVEVEGKVYDGSVRTQLNRLAKEMTGTTIL